MSPGVHHEQPSGAAPSSGLGLDDVYYTFFRHSKLILVCVCLGIVGALIAMLVTPSIYSSKVKLRVSFVMEDYPPASVKTGDNTRIMSPGGQGESVLNSEMEILTSRDVAYRAAEALGPAKVLAAYGGGDNTNAAASIIRFNLSVSMPKRSDVLIVLFEHKDKAMVQPVLNAVIQTYLEKQSEVHLGLGESEEFLSHQLAGLRKQLADNEAELEGLLHSNKLVFPADTRRFCLTQVERLTGELLTARTALALRAAKFGAGDVAGQTNQPTNAIPREIIREYSIAVSRLEYLEDYEKKLLVQGLLPAHQFIRDARQEMAERSQQKASLEQSYPLLVKLGEGSAVSRTNAAAELAEFHELTASVQVYENQISNLLAEAANVSRLEPRVQDLQRLHEEKENLYKKLSAKANGVGANSGNVPGVKLIENPTPPVRSDTRMLKLCGAIFGGFVGLALALAILRDYVFDRTLKRSVDVERHLRQRVFFTIPHTSWTKRRRPRDWGKKGALGRTPPGAVKAGFGQGMAAGGLASWNPQGPLREHADGLRERLVTYFEINAILHKPKLVGVTSCHDGAGVTSVANSLSAALSLTGAGNVMLVDLRAGDGSVTFFHKGKPGCGLSETRTQEEDDGQDGKPGNKLVVATVSGEESIYDKLECLLPEYFKETVPKLKTSGYDYIVFDLPPVSQTSITPRLASQMDIVLMVLESEQTGQPIAKRAATLMQDARANVVNVLNKCRRYVPESLSLEL